MKVAVMGAGGQGCFYGACLANAGNDVTFIARGVTLDALKKKGITLKSKKLGNIAIPVKATNNLSEIGTVELVLLCVKYYDLEAASEQIKPIIGDNTMVLPILNGVDVAEKVGQLIGDGHMLGGVSWVNTAVESPGVVSHGGYARLIFGELNGGLSERVERLDTVFRGAGIESELSHKVKSAIWEKFVFNGPGSCVMALTRLPAGPLRECPEAWGLMRRAMMEADEVAKGFGVVLPSDHVDRTLEAFKGYAPWAKPAILQDLEAGRRLELEALAGSVVRLGRGCGVPTPINDTIYAALKPYECGGLVLPKMP
jgi:2-dehydropantoate 2-reductase